MPWSQSYDPLHGPMSTVAAALPLVTLLGLLALRRVPAYVAAIAGLGMALAVAIGVIGMPAWMAGRAALLGVAYGLLPIGWIVLNVIFLYRITEERGVFVALQRTIGGITSDRRVQLLLIAFCFGAFFEGAAGFGTPVAVTGAMLIGLGFPPLEASALSLIANTAPVAFGALGTPVIALQGVSGLDLGALSAMIGRQLPIFSLIVPFWLIAAYSGFRGMLEIWPALLVAGVTFAVPQFLVSNFHGPWLVDIVASASSMVCLAWFLRHWRANKPLRPEHDASVSDAPGALRAAPPLRVAILPWVILVVIVFAWGLPQVKTWLNHLSAPNIPVPGLDKLVARVPPVVVRPTTEPAVFTLNWLSATGTAILLAAIISGIALRYSVPELLRRYVKTVAVVWRSLVTIAAMLALGYTTRYSGEDAILGLAFAHTGAAYPFFAAMLGWLGVALTGSDTSSNVLFGSLQRITASSLGLNPVLMAAANSSGGVMGKMIDAQSICVASTATGWEGHEWRILRYVFFHSLALASLVGLLVVLQQYVFTGMLVR
ncbi:MAG TPA: L-lactate permease [Gemmatimonadaceae bacterium]|jgi:lactate permease|nr:L-lactate permease [Gemmatimonadaceae bacterium]